MNIRLGTENVETLKQKNLEEEIWVIYMGSM